MATRSDLFVQFFQPSGFLDKDSSFWNIDTSKGNYFDALNVSGVGLTGNTNSYVTNVLGNTLAFTLPTISAQNKWYTVAYTSTTAGQILGVQFTNVNGTNFPTNVFATITASGSLTADASSLTTAISSALTAAGYTNTVLANKTINGNGGHPTLNGSIIVQITSQLGFDYIITNYSTATNQAVITIAQEAWDTSLAGLCIPTGSNTDLGDLYMISSSVGSDPVVFSINGTTISSPPSAFGKISMAGDEHLQVTPGMSVVISGVTGTTEANGTWIVTSSVYNAPDTIVTLYNTSFQNAWTGGGTLTIYASGLINIDVHTYNQTLNTWTNTLLLQTKQINSRWNHPERRVLSDIANGVQNLYFTDNNDVPRIFSYQGPFLMNGSILLFNPLGLYTYEGINLSMNLQLTNATPIVQSATVINTGGGVTAGLWRYSVTLQDATGTTSLPSILSPPVEIYVADETDPITVVGSAGGAGSPTSKQVSLNIIDIPVGVYTELNLIGVNYVQDTEVGYLIKTVNIPPNASTLTVIHTGNETYVNYDTSILTTNAVTYVKAGDLCIASNTLLMADLTAQQINDFSTWAQTFNHTISKGTTQLNQAGDDIQGYALGDYQDPNATFKYVGYMDNETYRFGVVVELLNGTRTPVFWIDDIRMDNFLNTGVPFNRAGITGNRRLTSFANYDLSPSSNSIALNTINAYVTYLTFSGINLNYLIAKSPISQIAKRIHIFRINNLDYGLNEILGAGLINRHATYSSSPLNQTSADNVALLFEPLPGNPPAMTQTYQPSSGLWSAPHSFCYGIWGNNIPDYIPDLYSASFYCPDVMYNQTTISLESGDKIYCYGQPEIRFNNGGGAGTAINETFLTNFVGGSPLLWWGIYLKMSGSTGITNWGNISDNKLIPIAGNGFASVPEFSIFTTWTPNTYNGLSPAAIIQYDGCFNQRYGSPPGPNFYTPAHYLICCTSAILQNNPNMGNSGGAPTQGAIDLGLYYIQYYRDKGSLAAYSTPLQNKFGAINTGVYIPTGAYIDIASVPSTSLSSASVVVYGGDTFTQKTYLKIKYPLDNVTLGGGTCVAFFCQNYFNFNMRQLATTGLLFPISQGGDVSYYVNKDISNPEGFAYDDGYTPRNIENRFPAFNPNIPNQTDYSTRKIFSLVKPQGALGNAYRQFPPLNFNDDAPQDGIIRAMFTVQGEVHTLQDYAFLRHFYNERGSLNSNESSSDTEIVLGSGTPFSKPSDTLSGIGTANQFSVLFGQTPQGEDLVAWIDVNGKNVMLYSAGKLRVISIERMMRTWFFNNLNLNGDIPVLNNSITGVWDDKRKEFIWTVFQFINAPQWNGGTNYSQGAIVTNGTTYEGLPATYTAQVANIGVSPPPVQSVNKSIMGTILGGYNSSGIKVTGDVTTSIKAGMVVQISGVTGTTEANGTWVVSSSTMGSGNTNIILKNVTFTNPYISGGTVSGDGINTNGTWTRNPDYYTIVYNTLVDGFTSFLSPVPYFYVPFLNTYLTAYPNTTFNGIYLSDTGNYCTWYNYLSNPLQVNGSLTWVCNENNRQDKRFTALSLNTIIPPFTINCITFKQNTFMGVPDTYNSLDHWLCPVKNDTITSPDGTPSNDSSALFGQWMQAQLIFQFGVQQSLEGVENKFTFLSRLVNR